MKNICLRWSDTSCSTCARVAIGAQAVQAGIYTLDCIGLRWRDTSRSTGARVAIGAQAGGDLDACAGMIRSSVDARVGKNIYDAAEKVEIIPSPYLIMVLPRISNACSQCQ